MVDDKQAVSLLGVLIGAIRAHDSIALETAIVGLNGSLSILDRSDADGVTPLLWAVREGQTNAVELLLVAGANPNVGLRADYSPLPLSISLREYAIAALLLETISLDLAQQGFVAATEAVIGRDIKGLECLVEHGFDLHQDVPPEAGMAKGLNRATALLFFAISIELPLSDVISYLLEQGADPKAVNAGYTLLGLLCSKANEYPEALQLLLEAGAQPEQLDEAGYAALHYASARNHSESVKILLAFSAQVHQRAHDGSFPLLWASCNGGHTIHAELLKKYDTFKLSADEKSVACLSPIWHWKVTDSPWGGFSLATGDGAWHALAWGRSAEEVIALLDRIFGSVRNRSAPCLIVYLPERSKQTYSPAPWVSPGRPGKFTSGKTINLIYLTPFFPTGIPRALPSAMIYRFLFAGSQENEKQNRIPGVIMKIVTFGEYGILELPEIVCHFDNQKWIVDTP